MQPMIDMDDLKKFRKENLKRIPNFYKAFDKFGEAAITAWWESMWSWIKDSDHEKTTVDGCIKGLPIYKMISPMKKPPKELYRGMSLYGSEPKKGKHTKFVYGTKQPACSWSESKGMAKSFGDFLLTVDSRELLNQVVFLWPTVNTEMEIIFNLKKHLTELEWAIKIVTPMPLLSVDIPSF